MTRHRHGYTLTQSAPNGALVTCGDWRRMVIGQLTDNTEMQDKIIAAAGLCTLGLGRVVSEGY